MSDIELRSGEWVVVLDAGETARVGDCRDCWYLRGHVTWWCKNPVAHQLRGTLLPGSGGSRCEFWREARSS